MTTTTRLNYRLGQQGSACPLTTRMALDQLSLVSTQEEKLRAKQAKLAAQAPGGAGLSAAPSDASSAHALAPWPLNNRFYACSGCRHVLLGLKAREALLTRCNILAARQNKTWVHVNQRQWHDRRASCGDCGGGSTRGPAGPGRGARSREDRGGVADGLRQAGRRLRSVAKWGATLTDPNCSGTVNGGWLLGRSGVLRGRRP